MSELAADIGNSRIKWGLCTSSGLTQTTAVPFQDIETWERQRSEWQLPRESRWTLAGTNPQERDRFADWLRQAGDIVRLIDDYRSLPLLVRVDHPHQVGIDRLLNAVAIRPHVKQGISAIIINSGSAVTVDVVDGEGDFRGGVIFPGFRLMAKSLNDYTAKLPFIESYPEVEPPLPATNTSAAIKAGITFAVRGGIEKIVQQLRGSLGVTRVFLAGGDSNLLSGLDCQPEVMGPFLTLEGIRLASRNIP